MTLAFDPFLPLPLLLAIALVAVLLVGWAVFKRMRGATLRALALAALVLALANPVRQFRGPANRSPASSPLLSTGSPSQMTPEPHRAHPMPPSRP